MSASSIITFPGSTAITRQVVSHMEQGDTTYWRRLCREIGVPGAWICPKCEDTGMVPVLDVDEVEWDICPLCSGTWGEPAEIPYTDDGFDEIPF